MNRFNIPKRDNYYGRGVKRNVRHKRLTDSNQQYSKAEEKLCIFTERGIRACGKRCGMSVVQAATVMTEHEPTPRAFRLQIALLAELFVFANPHNGKIQPLGHILLLKYFTLKSILKAGS